MREADEVKKNKLRNRDLDNKEAQNESKRQYIEQLQEIKQKKQDFMNKEREIAMADYKRNNNKIASPI